jgi:1-phosphofructokinase
MIYTITLNPSIDYIVSVPKFEIGKINRSTSEKIHIGGKGINVSKILKELGIESTICGFYAGSIGKLIQNELNKLDLPTILVEVKGCSRINVKLLTTLETAINGKGCKASIEDLDKLCNLINTDEESYVILSGSVCQGLDSNAYAHIMSKSKGKLIIDAEKDLLVNSLKYKPFLIKPNHLELSEIFNTQIDSFEKSIFYGKKLCEMGAENVIVSIGSLGAVFINKDVEYIVKTNKIEVKNTVGAGDTMLASFIYSLINKKSYEESLVFASKFVENKLRVLSNN